MRQVLVLCLAVLVVFLGLASFAWWSSELKPVSLVSSPQVYFSVSQGENASQIAARLQQAGLIRSPLVARLYLRLNHLDARIKPGGYTLSAGLTTPQVIATLTVGPKDTWTTLPEGWRKEQIAARLSAGFTLFDPQRFVELTATLEGRLFPDTYLLPQGLTADQAVAQFLANFKKKTGLEPDQSYELTLDSTTTRLTGLEVVTLASLVEREAKNSSDRPVIAGILIKRLAADWPLQVDATVQYARDSATFKFQISNFKFWDPVSDTKYPSAYNTYLHPGLPPGPVANPGLSAITAVLHPQATPYWYYLHSPDGQAHYAASLPEHNRNIDKYLSF